MPAITPDLSIVIVSYNTLEVTRQCLRSIDAGARELCFELTIVDNDSSDGSPQMVAQEFPTFRLIRNSSNRGVADATNQGLAASSGRYLLSMNSDVLVPEGAFAKLVRFMDEHPEAGAITPRLVLLGGGEHPPFIGNVPTLKSDLLFALCLLHSKFADLSNHYIYRYCHDYSTTREVPCIHWGTCFLVRREVVQAVGMQDSRYFVYCEDLDWAIRIRRGGWKLYYLAEVHVVHLLNQSTKRGGHRMYAQMWKSRCRLVGKNYGVAVAFLFRGLVASACSCKGSVLVLASLFSSRRRAELSGRMSLLFAVLKAVLSY